MKYCTNCGGTMQDEMRFCPACGFDSEKSKVPSEENKAENSAPSTQVDAEQSNPSPKPDKTGKKTAAIICSAVAVLIIAAGAVMWFGGFFDKIFNKETTTKEAETESVTSTTQPKVLNAEACMAAYEAFLTDYIDKNADSIEADFGAFSLALIDGDDIPELVVGPQTYHAAAAELYYFDGSSVVKLDDYGQFGQIQYLPQKNVFVSQSSGMGVFAGTAYKIENGKAVELLSYKEEPVELNSEEYRYYINEKEVSESEYRTAYDGSIPEEGVLTPDLYEKGSYLLNESGIMECFHPESVTTEANVSYTAKENSFSSEDGTLAHLKSYAFSKEVIEELGEGYELKYFNEGKYNSGMFSPEGELLMYYANTEKYGSVGLLYDDFDSGESSDAKLKGSEIIYGALHEGSDVIAVDKDLNSDATYKELTDRFETTEEKTDGGDTIVTFEYRNNDIWFFFKGVPSSDSVAYRCIVYTGDN